MTLPRKYTLGNSYITLQNLTTSEIIWVPAEFYFEGVKDPYVYDDALSSNSQSTSEGVIDLSKPSPSFLYQDECGNFHQYTLQPSGQDIQSSDMSKDVNKENLMVFRSQVESQRTCSEDSEEPSFSSVRADNLGGGIINRSTHRKLNDNPSRNSPTPFCPRGQKCAFMASANKAGIPVHKCDCTFIFKNAPSQLDDQPKTEFGIQTEIFPIQESENQTDLPETVSITDIINEFKIVEPPCYIPCGNKPPGQCGPFDTLTPPCYLPKALEIPPRRNTDNFQRLSSNPFTSEVIQPFGGHCERGYDFSMMSVCSNDQVSGLDHRNVSFDLGNVSTPEFMRNKSTPKSVQATPPFFSSFDYQPELSESDDELLDGSVPLEFLYIDELEGDIPIPPREFVLVDPEKDSDLDIQHIANQYSQQNISKQSEPGNLHSFESTLQTVYEVHSTNPNVSVTEIEELLNKKTLELRTVYEINSTDPNISISDIEKVLNEPRELLNESRPECYPDSTSEGEQFSQSRRAPERYIINSPNPNLSFPVIERLVNTRGKCPCEEMTRNYNESLFWNQSTPEYFHQVSTPNNTPQTPKRNVPRRQKKLSLSNIYDVRSGDPDIRLSDIENVINQRPKRSKLPLRKTVLQSTYEVRSTEPNPPIERVINNDIRRNSFPYQNVPTQTYYMSTDPWIQVREYRIPVNRDTPKRNQQPKILQTDCNIKSFTSVIPRTTIHTQTEVGPLSKQEKSCDPMSGNSSDFFSYSSQDPCRVKRFSDLVNLPRDNIADMNTQTERRMRTELPTYSPRPFYSILRHIRPGKLAPIIYQAHRRRNTLRRKSSDDFAGIYEDTRLHFEWSPELRRPVAVVERSSRVGYKDHRKFSTKRSLRLNVRKSPNKTSRRPKREDDNPIPTKDQSENNVWRLKDDQTTYQMTDAPIKKPRAESKIFKEVDKLHAKSRSLMHQVLGITTKSSEVKTNKSSERSAEENNYYELQSQLKPSLESKKTRIPVITPTRNRFNDFPDKASKTNALANISDAELAEILKTDIGETTSQTKPVSWHSFTIGNSKMDGNENKSLKDLDGKSSTSSRVSLPQSKAKKRSKGPVSLNEK